MVKYEVARRLSGKRVITNRGEVLGKLLDILVNEKTGELEYLIIEITADARAARKLGFEGKTAEIPYRAVISVGDVILVDEGALMS